MWEADDVWSPRWWSRVFSPAIVWGCALGLMGPFGTYTHPGGLYRLPYWVADSCCLATILGVTLPSLNHLGKKMQITPWFVIPIGLALSALIATYPIDRLINITWPDRDFNPSPISRLPALLLLSLLQLLIWAFLEKSYGRQPLSLKIWNPIVYTKDVIEKTRSADTIICLKSEDHYVRVYHEYGSYLILATIDQAIIRFGLKNGQRVHRSWWVCSSARAGVTKKGRQFVLSLRTGLEVPVARDRVKKLKEDNWI